MRRPSRARRRPVVPYRTSRGNYVHYGPQVRDAVSGLPIPLRLTVPQRGGRVDMRWSEGSRDEVEPIDHRSQSPTQLPVPVPIYRVVYSDGKTLFITDTDERDTAVTSGYTWTIDGYAYTDGDEETNLALLYRSFKASSGDHLFTTSAVEHANALAAGYVAETPDAYVSTTSALGRVPVYRAYRSAIGHH